jgi:hypothetical protein
MCFREYEYPYPDEHQYEYADHDPDEHHNEYADQDEYGIRDTNTHSMGEFHECRYE